MLAVKQNPMEPSVASPDFSVLSKMEATVSLLLSYPPVLLMKESSGRQFLPPAKGSSCHYTLLYAFKGTLGNGACVLCPKVIVMHGYSHAPQVTDIAGHIISRREVNELHPCVLAVCQYKIVFHDAFSFNGKCGPVVSTATHSKFSHISDSRTMCEPFLYAGHVVFGSDDCRMLVYLRKPRTFIVLHPSFEGVSSPCVRIGKHSVQHTNGVAECHNQRVIACPPSF